MSGGRKKRAFSNNFERRQQPSQTLLWSPNFRNHSDNFLQRQLLGLEELIWSVLLCIHHSLTSPVLTVTPVPKLPAWNQPPFWSWSRQCKLWKSHFLNAESIPYFSLFSPFTSIPFIPHFRTQEHWDLPPPEGVWIKTRCPAPIFQSLQGGNCGLNQYPYSGRAASLVNRMES